jgi:hypothetical protein
MITIEFEGINDYTLQIPEPQDSYIEEKIAAIHVKRIMVPSIFYLKIPAEALDYPNSANNLSVMKTLDSKNGSTHRNVICRTMGSPISPTRRYKSIIDYLASENLLVHPMAYTAYHSEHTKKDEYFPLRINFAIVDQATPQGKIIVGFATDIIGPSLLFVSNDRKAVKDLIARDNASSTIWQWYYTDKLSEVIFHLFEHFQKMNRLSQIKFLDQAKKDLVETSRSGSFNKHKPGAQKTFFAAEMKEQHFPAGAGLDNQAPIILTPEVITDRTNKVIASLVFSNYFAFTKAFDGLNEKQRQTIQDTVANKILAAINPSEGLFNQAKANQLELYEKFLRQANVERTPSKTFVRQPA